MPYFISNSASAGNFNNVGSRISICLHLGPPSDSQRISLSPMHSKFSTIIGEVDPSVYPTLDETVQQPKGLKTDDQPADHLPNRDDQSPTEAASLLAGEEKGWVRCIHPEGWIYFFKEHDHEPEAIVYSYMKSAAISRGKS